MKLTKIDFEADEGTISGTYDEWDRVQQEMSGEGNGLGAMMVRLRIDAGHTENSIIGITDMITRCRKLGLLDQEIRV